MQPGWSGAPAPTARASSQAIAGLVLAILWFLGAGSLAAVILAHIDRKNVKQLGQQQSGVGLAAMIVGYLGLVGAAFVIVLLATGVSAEHNAIDHQHQVLDVEANLRNLAVAEEVNLTNRVAYTNSATDLAADGFTPFGTDTDDLIVGYDGQLGYCLVGSAGGSDPWFLYDSHAQGLAAASFGSSSAAESACSLPISNYATIS